MHRLLLPLALFALLLVPSVFAAPIPHRIIPRAEWGADDRLLTTTSGPVTNVASDQDVDSSTSSSDVRVTQCETWQKQYPGDFKLSGKKITITEDGKTLRWPHTYSPAEKLIVVHHTAVQVSGDKRPAAERMRAIYQYHSVNRGWGDIGYHYVIAEDGSIFEGKAGGAYVVGGHAYCNNTSTIGIALMGNFEVEKPTQAQAASLQWLIRDLATSYGIDLTKPVTYHGKSQSAVVGHRDVNATLCPGAVLNAALPTIRQHAASGDVDAAVSFIDPPQTPPSPSTLPSIPEEASEDNGGPEVRRMNTLERKIRTAVRLSAKTKGRAWQMAQMRRSSAAQAIVNDPRIAAKSSSVRTTTRSNASSTDPSTVTTVQEGGPKIRIRLSLNNDPEPSISIKGKPTVILGNSNGSCIRGGKAIERFQATGDTVQLAAATLREYRGVIECRIINDEIVLINELPLEEYLMGLSEEPDTEPYEKQRAFAIAARSYAASYLGSIRKFPGQPYDGVDDPAMFQAYSGASFEKLNPRWLRAVASTAGQVLTKDGDLLKAAYFSSDDGRTRSPEENGWKNFPHSEVFVSKPDPWCTGMALRGHGVGMSGCGAGAQAREGKSAEEILQYYYRGVTIKAFSSLSR